jgi:hypothetical protein
MHRAFREVSSQSGLSPSSFSGPHSFKNSSLLLPPPSITHTGTSGRSYQGNSFLNPKQQQQQQRAKKQREKEERKERDGEKRMGGIAIAVGKGRDAGKKMKKAVSTGQFSSLHNKSTSPRALDGLSRRPSGTSSRSRGKGKQPFKMNPFRKKDEIELLRRRTHNRRRWSHVFPQGIAEFKRHAFINWTSLCQPAILPLTTDFFPTEAVLREEFLESFYKLTLDSVDSTEYSSHSDLLLELILQRLSQDMQVVPSEALPPSRRRGEKRPKK